MGAVKSQSIESRTLEQDIDRLSDISDYLVLHVKPFLKCLRHADHIEFKGQNFLDENQLLLKVSGVRINTEESLMSPVSIIFRN